MRVYVASKFENEQAVREAHRLLRERGHIITLDWTGKVATEEEPLSHHAQADFGGVASAHALILLHHPNVCGAMTEMGIALALRKDVIVIDADRGPANIFFSLPQVKHARDMRHALELLEEGR